MAIVIKKSYRPIALGTDRGDGTDLELAPHHLRTHLHVIGPTGEGKSRVLLHIFQQLCATGRPIVMPDFKGDLFTMARNWALTHGYTKRLVLIDLSADMLPGYNPLRENGLRIDLQAQWVSEGVKSAWGQTTFDETPQLARMLYLCLYVARALCLSLVDALDVLRPYPLLRERALSHIEDRFVHGALLAFEQLNDRRKEELAASTLARLEAFCRDETVRKVITSPQSLDLETLLSERKIVLLNFAKYQPLLPDPLKLLARMFTSDLLAHVYKGYGEGTFDKDHPVYFMCDEVQNMATRQLCDILDQGRGIGLHCILAHQHLAQLALEDQSGYLLKSVMNDARTKLIFGDLDYEDLEVLVKNVMLDRYNFWPTEDELGKTVRRIITQNRSHSTGEGMSSPTSLTEGESEGTGVTKNRSVTNGTQESTSEELGTVHNHGRINSTGRARTVMASRSHLSGWGTMHGTADMVGAGTLQSTGEAMFFPDGAGQPSAMTASTNMGAHENMAHGIHSGESEFSADGVSNGIADTVSGTEGVTDNTGITASRGRVKGSNTQVSEGTGESAERSKTWTRTTGVTPSKSEEWGESLAHTLQPLSVEEQTILFMQIMKNIPERHFLLKVPRKSAFIVAAPDVKEPWIGKSQLYTGLGRVYALPFYTHRDASVVDGEAQEILTPQQTIVPRLPDPEQTPPVAGTPPVGPTTFRRKRRQSEA